MDVPIGLLGDSVFTSIIDLSPTDNVLFSPLGVAQALSMLMIGEKDKSQFQLKSQDISQMKVHAFYPSLLNFYKNNFNNKHVLFSNLLLVSSSEGHLPPLIAEYIKTKYQVEVEKVTDEQQNLDKINSWVNKSTQGLVSQGPSHWSSTVNPPASSLVMLNSTYFKPTWLYEFWPDAEIEHFTLADGSLKKTSFVFRLEYFKYLEKAYGDKGDVLQIVCIPCIERLNMIVLLPPKSKSVNELIHEKSLTCLIKKFLRKRVGQYIELHMPKIDLKCITNMNSILTKMGMNIFDENSADLKGFSNANPPERLFVKDMEHLAVIDDRRKSQTVTLLSK